MDSEGKVVFIVFPFAFGFSLRRGAIESGIVFHGNHRAWPVPEFLDFAQSLGFMANS